MSAHTPRQIHAVLIVADRHHAAPKERANRHRPQPQGAQPNHSDVLAGLEMRFVITMGAEGIEWPKTASSSVTFGGALTMLALSVVMYSDGGLPG